MEEIRGAKLPDYESQCWHISSVNDNQTGSQRKRF